MSNYPLTGSERSGTLKEHTPLNGLLGGSIVQITGQSTMNEGTHMNRTKAKVLRRAAAILADKKSVLTWDGRGTRVYPKKSARAIYQRLKKEARDLKRYRELQALVDNFEKTLSHRGTQAAEAARSLLQPLGPFKGTTTGRTPADRPSMSNGPSSR